VIYAQSIGPFDNRFGKFLARFVLNRVDLITVRDEKSVEYLQKYNINKPPIYLTADPAFLLESAPCERISEILNVENIDKIDKSFVGLSIRSKGSLRRGISSTGSLEEKYQEYIKVMSKTVDYLIEKLDAEVIFIPHVIIPTEDDRIVHKVIYQSVKNKHKFKCMCLARKKLLVNTFIHPSRSFRFDFEIFPP
jgi:colanic acid/amylovoran biosynthesis protein